MTRCGWREMKIWNLVCGRKLYETSSDWMLLPKAGESSLSDRDMNRLDWKFFLFDLCSRTRTRDNTGTKRSCAIQMGVKAPANKKHVYVERLACEFGKANCRYIRGQPLLHRSHISPRVGGRRLDASQSLLGQRADNSETRDSWPSFAVYLIQVTPLSQVIPVVSLRPSPSPAGSRLSQSLGGTPSRRAVLRVCTYT